MEEDKYKVLCYDIVEASNMSLDVALMLVQAMMEKWYEVPEFSVTIRREKKEEICSTKH